MPCGLKTERLLLKASRYIILASLVISLTAVFFVANSFKRPHLNESRLYELAEEQEKFMENINTFFFERHKFKLKKYETMMRFKHTPVSAHISLAGAVRIPASGDKPESSVLVRKNIDSLDHARGVKVDKDGLVILHSGLYFVHASVTPEFSSRVAYTTWSMYIYKMRRNSQARTIKLTDTAHTFLSWTNSQNTGYSAGVFKLEAGEKLQLRLTGQSLIACDERSTFLGLFMLTSSSSYQK
uniref:THD domain-containing protein n=1 Tax=Biomphalaria glabrata TaxID=6526 RepID=A0A2C9M2J6_BIOGL